MSQPNQYMLMFSLGPVQSFISQARKTRDLWIGSFLLSKLMEAAMEGIDGTFVFPGERTINGTIPDLPNKYVVLFESDTKAEKAAYRSEMQIATRWYAICEEVRRRLLEGYYTAEVQEIWERQTSVRQFFEIYWVVVPNSGKGYGSWVRETALALEARKRLRDFLPQDEPGEKSTISGEREVLHNEGTTRRAVQAFWRTLTAVERHTVKDIKKDGSERLDAIDSVKRFALFSSHLKPGLDRIVYPSTSSVATACFVEKLLDSNGADELLEKWKRLTGDEDHFLAMEHPNVFPCLNKKAGDKEWILRRDGDLFFEEAFTPRYMKENYRITARLEEKQNEPGLRLVKNTFILDCLDALKGVRQAAGTTPTPYYALMQMDGDRMGAILSEVSDPEQHENMSRVLSKFAREKAPEIVQEGHPGRLIYAGGDDVLALSPLDGMLKMVDSLRQRYKEVVAPAAPSAQRQNVTASMGIAIAHHFMPLSVVRRAAREAENLAKESYGRNALVVTLLRRSGEQTQVGCHWEYPSSDEQRQRIEPVKLFQQFYTYFSNDILSPKSVHILLNEVPALVGLEPEAQCSEVRRVLKRQLNARLNDEQRALLIGEVDQQLSEEQKYQLVAKKIALLAEQIGALAAAMDQELEGRIARYERRLHKKIRASVELRDDIPRYGLAETFGWLLVMAFLAREGLET